MSNAVTGSQQDNGVEFDSAVHQQGYRVATKDDEFYLADCEVETLRRAALQKKLSYDPMRRRYTRAELRRYGLVREGYTREELRARGIGPGAVTSFDELAADASQLLPVETPFGIWGGH